MKVLEVADSPAAAVDAARRIVEAAGQQDGAAGYDVVLFTGSLYLIGAIRSILMKKTDYDTDRTLKYGSVSH